MSRYYDEYDDFDDPDEHEDPDEYDDYDEELEEARHEAKKNGEEFDEEEWLREHRPTEEDIWKEDEFTAEDPNEHEDPWAEDDHNARSRRGSGGRDSNRGLLQAEQNVGDFYDYAHMDDEDGHGISIPQLTAFEKDDEEKTFRKPESREEEHARKMERVAQKYQRNEDLDEESEAEAQLTDYEDDIISQAEDRVIEFVDEDTEEEHYRRLRDDAGYTSSADREMYDLHRELIHKLEFYDERISESPHDKDLYLPHVHGALEAIDNARHLYSKNRERQEELKEKRDSGELSEMQYQDQSVALDYNLQRRLTNNQYAAISGGGSMFGDVGEIMDRWNNLVDDTVSGDPDKLQDARDFIGQLPREIADQLIEEAVDEGLLDHDQANHFMTMAARPTDSLSHTPQPQKKGFGAKTKRFLGL
ncbi:hypothetical protein PDESU_01203 [Pontiella desulfatans]|uniref:Uncharacterized protein n=1 Tax=Pontiella desulfatans TaxID=2750659 RepID=A0A6C2TY88_PONDE|nr:hypothetical protein [Pontiella desulfatans]VGO12650.1 hypothetical protein PDESU_01203 [Pontiella desulfatans]